MSDAQPRPGGTSWWCPVCLESVVAIVTPADTETLLVDEGRCPDPAAKHGSETTLIGQVTTERVE